MSPPRAGGAGSARGRDEASLTAPAMRVLLTGAHEASTRLGRAAAMVDVADEALSRTQDLLDKTRGALSAEPGAAVDSYLNAIDETIGEARFGGAPILNEGVTISAGDEGLDVPPAST